MSKRRSPSNTWPTSSPPSAAATVVLHVGHVEPVARQRGAVECDREHGQAGRLLDLDVGRAGHRLEHALRCARRRRRACPRSSPNTLTATSRAHAGDQLVEAHLDRLRELVVVARHLRDRGLHLVRPAPPWSCADRATRSRGFSMTKLSATLGGIGSVAISAVPSLAKTWSTSGKLHEHALESRLHPDRLRQARARNAQRVQRDVAFVEAGDELAAHARRRARRRPRTSHGAAPPRDAPVRSAQFSSGS